MRKIGKRIFAVALVAVMLFNIPGTASYAEQAAADMETPEIETSVAAEPGEDDGGERISETAADDEKEPETDGENPEEETALTGEDEKSCDCGILCTQDSIKGDCPVCSAEGADISACRGEEKDNHTSDTDSGREDDAEDTETIKPEDAEIEDTDLCAHHKEHTEDCGYIPVSEDGEGSTCAYECRICPIEELIAVLPDKVTEDNAKEVRAQLDEILALYGKLTEEEQEQIDMSRCMELQEALDAANTPTLIPEVSPEEAVAKVEKEGNTSYVVSLSDAFAPEHSGATVTLLKDVDTGGDILTVPENVEITLDCGAFTLTGRNNTLVVRVLGVFHFTGGTLLNAGKGSAVYMDSDTGEFTMSGGKVDILNRWAHAIISNSQKAKITITGGTVGESGNGLSAQWGIITLSGGTYSSVYADYETVGDIVKEGFAFRGAEGLIRRDTSLKPELSNVTVVECPHTGAVTDKGDGTHGADTADRTCPYCGEAIVPEPHVPGKDGKCDGCREQLVA